MELYYKDLISEEASLEKLVDDLMRVVQGACDFAEAAGANLEADRHKEITTHLARLKESCRHIKAHAKATALAADQVLRRYPYSSAGFAFAAGLVAGAMFIRRRASRLEHP
jgi:ElaB/YqjD/DUF883 family membrane-anchored ribosome-binding protein